MCLCNPSIRTPWCGKPGCGQPDPAPTPPSPKLYQTPSDLILSLYHTYREVPNDFLNPDHRMDRFNRFEPGVKAAKDLFLCTLSLPRGYGKTYGACRIAREAGPSCLLIAPDNYRLKNLHDAIVHVAKDCGDELIWGTQLIVADKISNIDYWLKKNPMKVVVIDEWSALTARQQDEIVVQFWTVAKNDQSFFMLGLG